MTRLYFIVPVYGREDLTRVCLRQLRRTCDAVAPRLEATAVVIGEGRNLETARDLGFASVVRDNRYLGRKFNDGYQLACDPEHNPCPADYVVPCGSDDWIDPACLRRMPRPGTIGTFRHIAVVNPERTRISRLRIAYSLGAGIRIIPRDLVEAAGYRPAEEDRRRAIDQSTQRGLLNATRGLRMVPLDVHALQIVDWKSDGQQLNSYEAVRSHRRGEEQADPFSVLAEFFPSRALEEMRAISNMPVAA